MPCAPSTAAMPPSAPTPSPPGGWSTSSTAQTRSRRAPTICAGTSRICSSTAPPRPPPSATESPPQFYGWAVRDSPRRSRTCASRSKPARDGTPASCGTPALTRRMPEPGGMHRAEVIGLTVGSIDLDSDVAVVIGKGRGPRAGSPTGHRTGQALTRYLRASCGPGRGTRWQRSPALGGSARWRPDRQRARSGAGGPSVQPAIARVHPHQLRHTAADRWLGESGGNERPAITARKAGIADKLLAGLADHGHGTGSRTK